MRTQLALALFAILLGSGCGSKEAEQALEDLGELKNSASEASDDEGESAEQVEGAEVATTAISAKMTGNGMGTCTQERLANSDGNMPMDAGMAAAMKEKMAACAQDKRCDLHSMMQSFSTQSSYGAGFEVSAQSGQVPQLGGPITVVIVITDPGQLRAERNPRRDNLAPWGANEPPPYAYGKPMPCLAGELCPPGLVGDSTGHAIGPSPDTISPPGIEVSPIMDDLRYKLAACLQDKACDPRGLIEEFMRYAQQSPPMMPEMVPCAAPDDPNRPCDDPTQLK